MSDPSSVESVNEFWGKMREQSERTSAARGKVDGGRWVTISGLQSETGRNINGKVGQVVGELNSEGRYAVKVDERKQRILIKAENLSNISDDELVQTVRIAANGEKVGAAFHEVLFPRQHSMFALCDPDGNSPAMAVCGVPIVVKQTAPKAKLVAQGDYDCQWATWFMIDAKTGFAPPRWQSHVGPVLVYRPGGLDFAADDIDLLIEWFSILLDNYSEDGFDYREWMNPSKFQRFKAGLIANRVGYGSGLKHLHI